MTSRTSSGLRVGARWSQTREERTMLPMAMPIVPPKDRRVDMAAILTAIELSWIIMVRVKSFDLQ